MTIPSPSSNPSFASLLENSEYPQLFSNGKIINTIIAGSIIDIRNNLVVLDVGLKSEGFLSIAEFQGADGKCTIQVGDVTELFLKSVDDGLGSISVSRIEAIRFKTINKINSLFDNGELIPIIITDSTKGGLLANYEGIDCFLPGSLIDTKLVTDFEQFIGQTIDVKIIKIDTKKNSIVVSRKAALLADRNSASTEIFAKLAIGDFIEGEVKVLVQFGAFVDVGGVDGLIHISDLSWNRVSHPSKILSVGEKVKVKVISIDAEKGRLGLGLKQAQENPWEKPDAYPLGKLIDGVVESIADFGCFVSINGSNGLTGLVHISEMGWNNKNVHPSEIVSVGEQIKATITNCDFLNKKISLSIKQATENPIDVFFDTHNMEDIIKGTIQTTTDFGCFVELAPSVVGLIHISSLFSNKSDFGKINEQYIKGSEISVVVAKFNKQESKISLRLSSDNSTSKTRESSHESEDQLIDTYSDTGKKQTFADLIHPNK
jgi:small subunit ribosomal protein S1